MGAATSRQIVRCYRSLSDIVAFQVLRMYYMYTM